MIRRRRRDARGAPSRVWLEQTVVCGAALLAAVRIPDSRGSSPAAGSAEPDPAPAARALASEPAFTLYTSERCPFAARARMVLADKGVPYTSVEIELSDRPAYMFEKNPTGTVPVLEQDDGFVLPESRAIMEYLEERFPTPHLLPRGLEERARVRLALDQFEHFSGAYYGWRYRHEPAEHLHAWLDRLDRTLRRSPFLGGPEYGLADIGYFPWVLRAEHRGIPIGGYEALAEWVGRVQDQASARAEAETVRALPTKVVDTADLSFWA